MATEKEKKEEVVVHNDDGLEQTEAQGDAESAIAALFAANPGTGGVTVLRIGGVRKKC